MCLSQSSLFCYILKKLKYVLYSAFTKRCNCGKKNNKTECRNEDDIKRFINSNYFMQIKEEIIKRMVVLSNQKGKKCKIPASL